MKALPSIAYDAFSGSAKGVTARRLGGRTVLSVRATHSAIVSPAQAVSRNRLSAISRSFRHLTDAEMARWAQLAEQYNASSSLGKGAAFTAHNIFVRLNSNLVMVGGDTRTEAPIGLDNVPGVQIGVMYVNSDEVLIENVVEPSDDLRLVVKMSAAQSPGVTSAWSKTVIVSSTAETDWGALDLTDAFADVLGVDVEDGQKYFVELYWIDSVTGFSGQPLQFSGIAGPDPIYGSASGDSSRSIIRIKDLENDDRCYFKNFEYELSRGSVISTVKGEYGFKNTRTNAYVDLAPDQEELFAPQLCFLLCRGNYGSQWTIGFLEIEVRRYDSNRLGVTPHFANQTYGALLFDTGAPVTV